MDACNSDYGWMHAILIVTGYVCWKKGSTMRRLESAGQMVQIWVVICSLTCFVISSATYQTANCNPRPLKTPIHHRRIALARACYASADVYILDDPLSSQPPTIALQLFQNVIQGLIATSTRVLVTDQLHAIQRADYVILLDHGHIAAQGTYKELNASNIQWEKYSVSVASNMGVAKSTLRRRTLSGGKGQMKGKTLWAKGSDKVSKENRMSLSSRISGLFSSTSS